MIKTSEGEEATGHPVGNPIVAYPTEYQSYQQQASSMMMQELQNNIITIFHHRHLHKQIIH